MAKAFSKSNRLESFVITAISVIGDVHTAINESPKSSPSARALLPLVVDVKQKGQILLKAQNIAPTTKLDIWEHKLIEIMENLDTLESILRALPKPGCPDDVLLDGHLI